MVDLTGNTVFTMTGCVPIAPPPETRPPGTCGLNNLGKETVTNTTTAAGTKYKITNCVEKIQ